MRRFHDPVTILAATAALTVAGGVAQGAASRRQAEAQARDVEAQQQFEALEGARASSDLARESDATTARTRAILAAQGGDTASGTALALLKSQAGELGVRRQREAFDLTTRQASMSSRASAIRSEGRSQQALDIFGGVANAVNTGATLLRPATRTRTRGAA